MSEERLQEIKDSIEFQYKVQEANDLNNFNIFTDEEQELVDEIERLNNIINELEKELDKEYDTYITKNVIYGKTFKAGANVFREHIKYRLQELKGSDKE